MNRHDRNLVIVAVVALVGGLVIAFWASRGSGTDAVAPTSSATVVVATSTSTTTTTLPTTTVASTTSTGFDDRTVPGTNDKAEIERVSRRFVEGWLARSSAERTALLAGVATAQFLPEMQAIDQANVPTASLRGFTSSRTDGEQAYVGGQLTDDLQFVMYIVRTADGWRVAALDEA